MRGFIIRFGVVVLGLWLASQIVDGITINGLATLLGAALILGLINAVVRPVIVLLTLPITLITLGIFLLIINAAMLGLVAWLFKGFSIAGFWPALWGALIVSVTSWIASSFIGPRGKVDVIYVQRRY